MAFGLLAIVISIAIGSTAGENEDAQSFARFLFFVGIIIITSSLLTGC